MKIYTRAGDDGNTARLGGGRVPKDDPRIEASGAVDELNASLGCAAALPLAGPHAEIVARVQHELFSLGAELAGGKPMLEPSAVSRLEADIDRLEESLPPLTQFILPGGSSGAAALHLARTACRKAERRVVATRAPDTVEQPAVRYLNRLADLLFVLARAECHAAGAEEVVWSPGGDP